MPNHIIESVGRWGVKTRPTMVRLTVPAPGDPIDVRLFSDIYPFKGNGTARIAGIEWDEDRKKPMISACCTGGGSHFLSENGHVSVSGGPFVQIDPDWLCPTMTTRRVLFWNWGDNTPGAAQGVEYMLDRPAFVLTKYEDRFHGRGHGTFYDRSE